MISKISFSGRPQQFEALLSMVLKSPPEQYSIQRTGNLLPSGSSDIGKEVTETRPFENDKVYHNFS